MLTAGIRGAYDEGVSRLEAAGAARVCSGQAGESANAPAPVLFRATAAQVLESPDLQEEVFGSAGLVAAYESLAELKAVLEALPGQLTATIHMAESDHEAAAELSAAAGAQGGPADRQRLADGGGGQPRHGARRAVPGHIRSPLHVGGHAWRYAGSSARCATRTSRRPCCRKRSATATPCRCPAASTANRSADPVSQYSHAPHHPPDPGMRAVSRRTHSATIRSTLARCQMPLTPSTAKSRL